MTLSELVELAAITSTIFLSAAVVIFSRWDLQKPSREKGSLFLYTKESVTLNGMLWKYYDDFNKEARGLHFTSLPIIVFR